MQTGSKFIGCSQSKYHYVKHIASKLSRRSSHLLPHYPQIAKLGQQYRYRKSGVPKTKETMKTLISENNISVRNEQKQIPFNLIFCFGSIFYFAS